MEIRELTCIVCPRGCHLKIDENHNVTGNFCPRGATYAKQEVTDPRRVVTSTVKTDSALLAVLPVKTSAPVPKGRMFDVMKEIEAAEAKVPVAMGQVVIRDVCGLGVDVIATRPLPR